MNNKRPVVFSVLPSGFICFALSYEKSFWLSRCTPLQQPFFSSPTFTEEEPQSTSGEPCQCACINPGNWFSCV